MVEEDLAAGEEDLLRWVAAEGPQVGLHLVISSATDGSRILDGVPHWRVRADSSERSVLSPIGAADVEFAATEGVTPEYLRALSRWLPRLFEPVPEPLVPGRDTSGDPVGFPALLGGDGSVGLVVGDTAERQAMIRTMVRDHDGPLVLVGLGEPPAGPGHSDGDVLLIEDELLADPERLAAVEAFIDREVERRAPGERPPLLLVVDVSLTIPPHQRGFTGLLVRIAQRARRLGIHFVLAATEVEDTAAWNGILALTSWRMAVSPLPPRPARNLFGRARLPFPDEPGGTVLRVGREPPIPFRPPTLSPRGSGPRLVVGTTADSEPVTLDPFQGQGLITGGGEGARAAFLGGFALRLALRLSPEQLNLVLIDPQATDVFAALADLPHLAGAVTGADFPTADALAEGLAGELERRRDAGTDRPTLLILFHGINQRAVTAGLTEVLERITRKGPRSGVLLVWSVPRPLDDVTWTIEFHDDDATLHSAQEPPVTFRPVAHTGDADPALVTMVAKGARARRLEGGP